MRKNIGIVPQETVLFSGTIYENISYGTKNISKEEVMEAARMANAYNFINELPNGFETEVGEKGVKLSGGQKQRIAIARALIQNPKILILDEATSALDKYTEEQIMKEIYALNNNITLFIITHNPKITYGCDDIYRIIDGKLLEDHTK